MCRLAEPAILRPAIHLNGNGIPVNMVLQAKPGTLPCGAGANPGVKVDGDPLLAGIARYQPTPATNGKMDGW